MDCGLLHTIQSLLCPRAAFAIKCFCLFNLFSKSGELGLPLFLLHLFLTFPTSCSTSRCLYVNRLKEAAYAACLYKIRVYKANFQQPEKELSPPLQSLSGKRIRGAVTVLINRHSTDIVGIVQA